MRKLIMLLILFTAISGYTEKQRTDNLSTFKDNYFTKTLDRKEEVQGQISVKMNLIYPETKGIYFAYTNTFWWDIGKYSSPFREFNHEPLLFYEMNNNNILNNKYINNIRVGGGHKSNGKAGVISRSIDYFGFTSISYHYQITSNYQIGGETYISIQKYGIDNKDMKDYWNSYSQSISFINKSQNTIEKEKITYSIKPSRTFKNFNHSLEGQVRLFNNYIQPYLYMRIEYGYLSNGLVEYNKKELSSYAGIIFK